MDRKIYKYIGPDILKLALANDGYCGFKCSFPNEFNDPFELFLTIDFKSQSPEILAYYCDVIGNINNKLVTCFSKAPDVIPMWAHYGQNHQGIVLEFDEKAFSEHFPDAWFDDVIYNDSVNSDLEDILIRAYHIGKPRYHFFLINGVYGAAYFTKHIAWSYEKERRLVVSEEIAVRREEINIIEFPASLITSLIVGNAASDETKDFVAEKATRIGSKYYEMKIGRSSTKPYFIDRDGRVSIFNEVGLEITGNVCSKCKEPIHNNNGICAWCGIEDSTKINAASKNPLRILQHLGLFDDWWQSMLDVRKGK